MAQLQINPGLDLAGHAAEYGRAGVVTLPAFLAPDQAERLHDEVSGRGDWQLRMKGEGPRIYQFDRAAADGFLDEPQLAALRAALAPRTDRAFGYVFDRIQVREEDGTIWGEGTALGDFGHFISSESMIDVAQRITGDDVVSASAFCSRYNPGDYLTVHDDRIKEHRRLAAFVFGLTPNWRPEWGGLLLFHDQDGHVERGFCPKLNSLTIFSVPRRHSVSAVAEFAPRARLAISGWFYAGSPDPLAA